jgi:hypothetical protein
MGRASYGNSCQTPCLCSATVPDEEDPSDPVSSLLLFSCIQTPNKLWIVPPCQLRKGRSRDIRHRRSGRSCEQPARSVSQRARHTFQGNNNGAVLRPGSIVRTHAVSPACPMPEQFMRLCRLLLDLRSLVPPELHITNHSLAGCDNFALRLCCRSPLPVGRLVPSPSDFRALLRLVRCLAVSHNHHVTRSVRPSLPVRPPTARTSVTASTDSLSSHSAMDRQRHFRREKLEFQAALPQQDRRKMETDMPMI